MRILWESVKFKRTLFILCVLYIYTAALTQNIRIHIISSSAQTILQVVFYILQFIRYTYETMKTRMVDDTNGVVRIIIILLSNIFD